MRRAVGRGGGAIQIANADAVSIGSSAVSRGEHPLRPMTRATMPRTAPVMQPTIVSCQLKSV